MAVSVVIPVKTYNGEKWLDLEAVLGKRVVVRAHEIDLKHNVLDFKGHHVPEAHAKRSVKCKSKTYEITDKIVQG